MKSDVDWGPGGTTQVLQVEEEHQMQKGGGLIGARGGVMDMHRAHLVSNASFVVAMLPALMADRTTLRVV